MATSPRPEGIASPRERSICASTCIRKPHDLSRYYVPFDDWVLVTCLARRARSVLSGTENVHVAIVLKRDQEHCILEFDLLAIRVRSRAKAEG
jgi:hypothetical protein